MFRMLSLLTQTTMFWKLLYFMMFLYQIQGDNTGKESYYTGFRCPKGSVTYYSYCYDLYMAPTAWMDASIACQRQPSGHLVSILSRSEASFVSALIKKNMNSGDEAVWIGLHDPTEGVYSNGRGWEWNNHDVSNYRAWEINPPIPYAGFCGGVTKSSGFQKWKNYNCDVKLPYICKFKH